MACVCLTRSCQAFLNEWHSPIKQSSQLVYLVVEHSLVTYGLATTACLPRTPNTTAGHQRAPAHVVVGHAAARRGEFERLVLVPEARLGAQGSGRIGTGFRARVTSPPAPGQVLTSSSRADRIACRIVATNPWQQAIHARLSS